MSTAEFGIRRQLFNEVERGAEHDAVRTPEIQSDIEGHTPTGEAMQHLAVASAMERRTLTEWLRTRYARAITGIAAVSLAGGVLVGCGESAANSYAKPEVSSSASANPSKSTGGFETNPDGTTNFETKTKFAPTIYDTDAYKALDAKAQHEVQLLEEMSYETFRELDYPRQAAYGEFFYEAYKDYGEEQIERQPYYRKNTPDTTNEKSTGQQIVDQFYKQQSTLYYALSKAGYPYSVNEKNRVEVEKALSYLYPSLLQDSKAYTNSVEAVKSLDGLEPDGSEYNGDGYSPFTVDRESIVGPSGTTYGKGIKYTNRRYQDDSVSQYIYEYNEFDKLDGTGKFDVWQLALVVNEGHPAFKPDVESLFK